MLPIKAINVLHVLVQVAAFQPKRQDILKDRENEVTNMEDELFILLKKRVLPKIVIQVADQVRPALLLPARHGVVATVEIGHQHSVVFLEKLLDKRGLSRRRKPEDHMPPIS